MGSSTPITVNSTYRKLLCISHNTLWDSIHQRLDVQVQERIQAYDVLLVCEEQGDKDAEQTAQHEDEAIATFAARSNHQLLDLGTTEFISKLIFLCLVSKEPRRVEPAGRVLRRDSVLARAATQHSDRKEKRTEGPKPIERETRVAQNAASREQRKSRAA